jgi:hypothetical protein
VLGLAVVLFIICGSKFELQYFLIPTFAKRNHVIGKGPERFAEKIKIRFSWLCSQTGKHRDFKIWRKYSRFQAPGSPYRLDINHEKKFYVSGLHKLCFENYIGGI